MGKIRDIAGIDPFGRDWHDSLTGKTGADAALQGAQLQYDAAMAGIDAQQESERRQLANLNPYRNLANRNVLNMYKNYALNVPGKSYDPTKDQLMMDAANFTSDKLLNIQAAQGKAGAGGTQLAINQALAPMFMQRQQQIFGNMNQLVSNSQNAAAGQGAAIAGAQNAITDLYGQGGNALAAGGIGASNAIGQGTANAAGIAGGLLSFFCDERLKEDVSVVGKDSSGLKVCLFKYKGQEGKYVGRMAQDIAKVDPDHVFVDPETGYLKVTSKYAPVRVA
jgi:hypothetical protein